MPGFPHEALLSVERDNDARDRYEAGIVRVVRDVAG